jgi:hypothetical protein
LHSIKGKVGDYQLWLVLLPSRRVMLYNIIDERAEAALPFRQLLQCYPHNTQLHPMDAFHHAEGLTSALEAFTNAFKDRI